MSKATKFAIQAALVGPIFRTAFETSSENSAASW